jgi:hypothetical protein
MDVFRIASRSKMQKPLNSHDNQHELVYEVDETDRRILRILKDDGRAGYSEIANAEKREKHI